MAEFNDPGEWHAASYSADPIDTLEPLESVTSEYRLAAIQFLELLKAVDEFMSTGVLSRKWLAVSLSLGLPSTRGRTETAIANERFSEIHSLNRIFREDSCASRRSFSYFALRFLGIPKYSVKTSPHGLLALFSLC